MEVVRLAPGLSGDGLLHMAAGHIEGTLKILIRTGLGKIIFTDDERLPDHRLASERLFLQHIKTHRSITPGADMQIVLVKHAFNNAFDLLPQGQVLRQKKLAYTV